MRATEVRILPRPPVFEYHIAVQGLIEDLVGARQASLAKIQERVRSAEELAAIRGNGSDCGKPECAWVAQLVERVLGKDEVTGSIPVPGSSHSSPEDVDESSWE